MANADREGFLTRLKEIWPLIPAALYLLGFLLIVLVYLVGLSFSGGGVTEPDRFPSLGPLKTVLNMPEFWEALRNTAVFVIIGTPLELVSGLFMALLLYRSFRTRNFFRSLFLIPLAIPALVTATLLFILFDFPGGHVNHLLMGKYPLFPQVLSAPVSWRSGSVFALGISMLGKVWRDLPISMLILTAGLNGVDPEFFDAAKTMGAGFFRRLRYVILPLIIPSVSAVVLLRSLEMWKEFIFPFVLAGRHNLLGTLIESLYNNWGRSSDAAVVALALVMSIVVSTAAFMWLMERARRLLVRI